MVLKVANWVMLAAFLFSVAVQYNDPDPVRWMLIYGLAALACILKLMGRLKWYLPAAVGAAAFGWAASLAPGVIGKTTLGEMFQSVPHDQHGCGRGPRNGRPSHCSGLDGGAGCVKGWRNRRDAEAQRTRREELRLSFGSASPPLQVPQETKPFIKLQQRFLQVSPDSSWPLAPASPHPWCLPIGVANYSAVQT